MWLGIREEVPEEFFVGEFFAKIDDFGDVVLFGGNEEGSETSEECAFSEKSEDLVGVVEGLMRDWRDDNLFSH